MADGAAAFRVNDVLRALHRTDRSRRCLCHLLRLASGITAVYDIVAEQAVFLDVAIVLALIAFLGTVAFARYIEKQVSQ